MHYRNISEIATGDAVSEAEVRTLEERNSGVLREINHPYN